MRKGRAQRPFLFRLNDEIIRRKQAREYQVILLFLSAIFLGGLNVGESLVAMLARFGFHSKYRVNSRKAQIAIAMRAPA
jgi:hypothetical protein